jgi:hypothetical protein
MQEVLLLSNVRTRGFVQHLDASKTFIGLIKLRCHQYGFEVPAAELAAIAAAEGERTILQVHLCYGSLTTKEDQEAAIRKVKDKYMTIRPAVFSAGFNWLMAHNPRYAAMQPPGLSAVQILERYTDDNGGVLLLKGKVAPFNIIVPFFF